MNDNALLSIDNGVDTVVDADATLVAKEYYTSYSKYVLEYRALPSVYDGLKPVQRRIIYTANQFPQKLMKTAKLSGAVLAYHPHGSSSVTGAINNMAHPLNALPLFTTKGNFGGVNCGPSADRYTECYLSEIARKNFCQFMDYADYEVGEIGEMEPSALPTLIPYCLFAGSEGIGVGLSTKVMPLNLLDLVDYYIDYIKHDGVSHRKIKPDVGYSLLEMTDNEVNDAVSNYRGRISVSSVVTQLSNTTFLIEGLYDKSIDAVINKIDRWSKWFSQDKVGFRDASTSSIKYVFEIYDNSIDPAAFKNALVDATRKSGTFTRVLEEDGNAVYSSFNYVVKKSLECLNKAIDKRIASELDKSKHQLSLYEVLEKCKSLGLFNSISQLTVDELVNLITTQTNCDIDIAREVVKKPISYLTRSHGQESKDLEDYISELENHDRKKYLISLYKDLRKSILPIYESKKHTITQGMVLNNPCIKFISSDSIQITDGDGEPFDNTVYFISDKGYIYKRSLGSVASSDIIVETSNNDKVIGVVTDKSKYVEIVTHFSYEEFIGCSIIDLSNISYDKRLVSLREDTDGEHIVEVKGINDIPDEKSKAVKGSKVSKTTFFRVK